MQDTDTDTEKTATTTSTKSTESTPVTTQNTITENQTVTPTTNTTSQSQTLTPETNTIATETQANPVNNTPSTTSDQNTTTEPATPVTTTTAQNPVNAQEEPEAAAGDTYTDVNGIWLKAEDISKISVNELKNANITDIFVKTNLLTAPTYQTVLSEVASKFQNTGIRIHAWITCFKDADGKWVDPANATQRAFLLNAITNIVKNYNIDGIHLDYVRYSGVGDNAAYKHEGASANITSFIKDVYNTVKSIKPKMAVSAAVMPEGSSNANLYGQDYKAIAPYLDFIVPMLYKGNYNADTAWIGSATKYIVEQAGGTPVIAGLQTYVSDYDTTKLPASDLNTDIKSATNNGASGYVLFRYGTISQDFLNPPSFTMNEISDAAKRLKSYVDTNKKLPNYVTIGTTQVSMPEVLKLMAKYLVQLNNNINTPIKLMGVSGPQKATSTFTTGNIGKSEYLELANRVNSFIDSNSKAPGYATSSLGKINYESLVYSFAKIAGYYNTNGKLPAYVSMNSAFKIKQSTFSGSTLTVFNLDQIQKAATNVKKYIETNHKLPSYVTVGTTQIKPADFLRLMLISTIEINDGVKMPISLKAVGMPGTPGETIKSGNLTEASYLDLAKRLKAFIDANGKLPNHASTPLGEIKYESMMFLFAKILSFEDTSSRLPSYVSVTPWSTISTPASDPVPSSLLKYIAATANCNVNNAQIKALAAKITSGKTTTYAKAAAIFNWVRNNLGYSFYYNTKYGAVGALNAGTGNCVDTAHLIIALERAAGIPAKYVHGTVRFPSGSVYGHVWAQVYVNGKWYTADGTSSRNTFGNMVGSVLAIKGYYASLPF